MSGHGRGRAGTRPPQLPSRPGGASGQAWRLEAACADVPVELFFPPGEVWPAGQLKNARAVCARCPVWEDCLSEALESYELGGMWAGLTPRQRLALRPEGPGSPPAGWVQRAVTDERARRERVAAGALAAGTSVSTASAHACLPVEQLPRVGAAR